MRLFRKGKGRKARTLKLYGLDEKAVRKKLEGVAQKGLELRLLSHPKGVDLTIVAEQDSEKAVDELVDAVEQRVSKRLGVYVFGSGNEKMEDAVGKALIAADKTIAAAESCTGGLICHWLTNVPGSSSYFKQGIIAYSDESKMSLLKVDPGVLEKHGAVSKKVVERMAISVRELSGADIGLAVSGIAGPGGGTAKKPVGLVWIGFADGERVTSEKHRFQGRRDLVKIQAAQAALDMVRRNVCQVNGK